MNINRDNYELFFLLYADKELSAAERQAVDAFVEQHPDLKAELEMLLQTVLPALETSFPDKEALFRTTDTTSLVNMTNYESYFVRYHDDELNNEEKAATELFVYQNPECQPDFELIQQCRLMPEKTIVFPDKQSLYRKEKKAGATVIGLWVRIAVAAILLLLAGLYWLKPGSGTDRQQPGIAQAPKATKDSRKETTPVVAPAQQPPQELAAADAVKEIKRETVTSAPAAINGNKIKEAGTRSNNDEQESASQLAVNEQPSSTHELTPQTSVPTTTLQPEKPEVAATGNLQPVQATTQPVYVQVAEKSPSQEDYVFVQNDDRNNDQLSQKKPLRGLLRKASRVIEQNNPLGAERRRQGVFTASAESQ
ncbi:hypothetical protein [Flavihumibacter petaseus]|uniref:Uncharacterized protein n=1 Tax=Flavihumibacter petaseus NBRC 106054 TaxID=1220578 RepID=A0A0E9N7G5_9BACT|nr:hypothetical protein [Flavihumibacter petaseus]GAO45295.1 hypothetical protein FPE01S_04_05390 [Flavihumibacter petaseus NBRC 106054]